MKRDMFIANVKVLDDEAEIVGRLIAECDRLITLSSIREGGESTRSKQR